MNLRVFFIYYLFIYYCESSHLIDDAMTNFIVDVTSSLYAKSSLTAFFCLDQGD